MALRVINGLAVHRLTTGGDIHVPIGPTAAELKSDSLCLFQPGVGDMPGEPAENLLSMVQTVMREVLKRSTASLSPRPPTRNSITSISKGRRLRRPDRKRAPKHCPTTLDRAYYSAIKALMECSDDLRYPGFQIWQYQIEWQETASNA